MKRIQFVGLMAVATVVGFGGRALAADKPAAAAGSMKTENCGAMMKSLVPLPTKFAELMQAVTDGMTAHANWIAQGKDPAAKAEAAAMKKIALDHQAVMNDVKKAAADMEAAGTLQPAPHDMSKMDPKQMGEMMMKQATLEREMAALMVKHADDTEKAVKEMSKAAPQHASK
jgi:hypothetical protein